MQENENRQIASEETEAAYEIQEPEGGGVYTGMLASKLLSLWGEPNEVLEAGENGRHFIWIYHIKKFGFLTSQKRSIYIDNGRVSGWKTVFLE